MKMLFTAHAIPGRLAMETGGFWGIIAECPTPRLGLSYRVVRRPPLSDGSPHLPCLAWPAFFPALLAGVRCREMSPPVVAGFVGGHGDGAIQGKDDELVARPALGFPAMFQPGYR